MLSRCSPPAGFIEPCLPTLAHAVTDGPLWVHEIKHDGYRFIVCRDATECAPSPGAAKQPASTGRLQGRASTT
jgi:hypothetical protein